MVYGESNGHVRPMTSHDAKCRNMQSNVSNAQINRGWVTLGPNLGVFLLEQTRLVGVAKSERPRLTNGEIIFEEFQPM